MSPITELIGSVKAYGWGSLVAAGDYESIATTTVGSGGSSNVEFTSIPGTYTHLQIRLLGQSNRGTYNIDSFKVQVGNSTIDTASNYSRHELFSSQVSPGSSVLSDGGGNTAFFYGGVSGTTVKANTFGVSIIDVLDYANTNKYKTFRCLSAAETNGADAGYAGFIQLSSGSWRSTSAIDRIKIFPETGTLWTQYSHFALYGIKGA